MSAEDAKKTFNNGFNCSQSVFSAFAGRYGVERADAMRIAAGFGGGFGHMQTVCGAVSGAVMAIGCKYFDMNETAESKNLVYEKTFEFMQRFKKIHGSVDCWDLLGVDLKTEEGVQEAREKNYFQDKCGKYVQDACTIVDSL